MSTDNKGEPKTGKLKTIELKCDRCKRVGKPDPETRTCGHCGARDWRVHKVTRDGAPRRDTASIRDTAVGAFTLLLIVLLVATMCTGGSDGPAQDPVDDDPVAVPDEVPPAPRTSALTFDQIGRMSCVEAVDASGDIIADMQEYVETYGGTVDTDATLQLLDQRNQAAVDRMGEVCPQ